jgi:hypothetical protein
MNKLKAQSAVGSSELVRKRRDRDVLVLERCCRALDRSTSPRMLKANLAFLVDRYITHPNKEVSQQPLDTKL